jgi:uncharacterized protein (DUF58 family)
VALTSRATGLIALIAGFAIGGEVANWELLSQLAMGLLVLLAVCWLWARSSLSGLTVARSVTPEKLQVGDVLVDTIEVRSRSQMPKLWVEVRDLAHLPGHDGSNVVSLRRKGSASWLARSIAVRRGVFAAGPVELRSGDPLGVFQRSRRIRLHGDLTVYPPVFDLPALRLPFADATGRREIERRALMATPSVATVRDYVAGDPMNRISWALTARMGSLMVKEFDLDPTAEIWIVADFSSVSNLPAARTVLAGRGERFEFAEAWLDSSEDAIAAIAASAVKLVLDRKRAAGYIGSSGGRTVLNADIGDRQYHRILTELAVAQPSGSETVADVIIAEVRRFDRNRTPIVISSSADPRWIEALQAMTDRGIRPIAIFLDPATLDPARESTEIHERIREMPFPVFVVDFAAGIGSGFALHDAPIDHSLRAASQHVSLIA